MTRSRPRPILCACLCILFLVAVYALAGCATASKLHSWGDGTWPWADFGDRCWDNCSI